MTDAQKAAAELWRLAQAEEIIRSHKAGRQVPLDGDGKVIPSKKSIDAASLAHPDLARRARDQPR